MKTYALIEDGAVSEVIPPYVNPDGVDVPIEDRYTPNMVAMMVDITDMDPQPQQRWTYDGTTFSPPQTGPTLAQAVVSKIVELRQNCDDEIERTSFTSSALGTVHNYDCRTVDQINITIRYAVANHTGGSEPLWASDGTRYTWKEHTAEELVDVMVNMNEHIKENQVLLVSKLAAVDAATTVAQINAVTW